jgi:phage-related protein
VWTVEYLDEVAKAEVDSLPNDIRSRFQRIVSLIEIGGLEKVHEPYVKHIEDKIWEMRMSGKDGIARSFYVTAHQRRVVVLRTFIKKTQKTPSRELSLAKKRAKEVT